VHVVIVIVRPLKKLCNKRRPQCPLLVREFEYSLGELIGRKRGRRELGEANLGDPVKIKRHASFDVEQECAERRIEEAGYQKSEYHVLEHQLKGSAKLCD
jgi:hypothetical protein